MLNKPMISIDELNDMVNQDEREIKTMITSGQHISFNKVLDLQAHLAVIKDEIIKNQADLISELETQLAASHLVNLNAFGKA